MKPVTVVESIVTYISVGWAYVLLTTPDLFSKSESFSKIQSISHFEWVVGLIALLCAVTKMVGMSLKMKRIRWLGLIMSSAFWIIIATGMLISQGHIAINTGFVAYSGIAVMCLWTSKEVMTNDRTE